MAVSLKEFLLLLGEYIEAYAEFIKRVGELEMRGLRHLRGGNERVLMELWSKAYSEFSKEQFITIMSLFYDLGRMESKDVWSLSPEEKIQFAMDLLEVTRRIKRSLGGEEHASHQSDFRH